MSIFNDKALKGVAEAAAKIMAETSHGTHPKTPKEKSLAALAHPKDKITHKDVLVGRGVLKKEEKEQLQEYESKAGTYKHKGSYGSSYNTDDEDDSPKRAQKGYGAHQNKGVRGKSEGTKKEKDEDLADTGKRMKPGRIIKTKTGLIHKMNESLSFTEMLELYNEHGLKVLAPIEKEEQQIGDQTVEVIDADKINGVVATAIEEEATEEEFNKELKDQQASFAGKKKQPKVAAGKTTGVKVMPEEIELDEEQLDEISKETAGKYLTAPQGKGANKYKVSSDKSVYPNIETMTKHSTNVRRALKRSEGSSLYKKPDYYKEETELDERTLTPAETAKKEQIVKSMKKGLAGFKQRYGERAKEVMYATATKQAKKD